MSYDMFFWRQTRDLQLEPEQVINRLAEDRSLEGVTTFPRTIVREAFRKSFPNIVDHDFELDWEGDGSYFQVNFNHATEKDVHLIIVACGSRLLNSDSTMNRIIDTCLDLGCALYDSQTGQRYGQSDPKAGV